MVKPVNLTWGGYRGYIMQAVQNELLTTYHYSQQRINTGGLHIVTTFNKTLMNRLYATVRSADALMRRCAPPPILSSAATAPCKGLPKWVRAGAVLEDVKTGAILAMYGGPNYNKKHCHCQFDNALQSRNQVGSSFKTYVLATAVDQGMNVQSSILNGDSPLWIPPDSSATTLAKTGGQSPGPGYYQVVNDESGNNNFGPVPVQKATAASLNTAYTDLWHRVAYNTQTGQHPVVSMAKAFGVDIHASGLKTMEDQAGTALGQASLTVEEQATTIATLADNGVYHSPHVIKKIIVGNSVSPAKVTERTVLTPNQAADVDWALSADTTAGGTAAGLGLTNGQPIIAKTGTTNLSQSAFFMAATTRYAMADALFVEQPRVHAAQVGSGTSASPPGPWRSRRRRACSRCSASAACPVTAGNTRPTSGTSSSCRTSTTCRWRISSRSTTTGRSGTCSARCPSPSITMTRARARASRASTIASGCPPASATTAGPAQRRASFPPRRRPGPPRRPPPRRGPSGRATRRPPGPAVPGPGRWHWRWSWWPGRRCPW